MDLLGMNQDGQLYLCSAAAKVQPVDRFPMTGKGRVVSGDYVLEVRDKAVAVHVSNGEHPGNLVVQSMCSKAMPISLPLRFFECDLLGRVIPDPKAEAGILDMLRQMTANAHTRNTGSGGRHEKTGNRHVGWRVGRRT